MNKIFYPIFATLKKKSNRAMSKICDLTGKKSIVGNSVSFSNAKTKRRFNPNLQMKKYFIPETGEWITLKVSTSAMRTINKKGISKVLADALKKDKR